MNVPVCDPSNSISSTHRMILSLVTALVCLLSTAIVGRMIMLPWDSLITFFLWTIIAAQVDAASPRRKYMLLVPAVLSIFAQCVPPPVAIATVGAWFIFLGRQDGNLPQSVLRQTGRAALLFAFVDLVLYQQGSVSIWLTTFLQAITGTIRNALGYGEIAGPEAMKFRLLIFSVLVVVPLRRAYESRIALRYGILIQVCFLALLLPTRSLVNEWFYNSAIIVSSGILLHLFFQAPRSAEHSDDGPAAKNWVGVCEKCLATAICMLIVAQAGDALGHRKEGEAPRILFVDDSGEGTYSDHDMTNFAPFTSETTEDEFHDLRFGASYSILTNRFLPALGYDVDVLPLSECTAKTFGDYDAVLLICIQHELSESVQNGLLQSVQDGDTNLLVAGDHTDIGSVQKPFNALLAPLGIRLNYDSIFPFNGWNSDLIFHHHVINGPLSVADRSKFSTPGISVGGSLSVNWKVAAPLISAADGYTDEGTPDSPQVAGLGDRMYTSNEHRGGQVLAAERSLGKGTILAFGDTAFLQSASVHDRCEYIASVFDYLVCGRRPKNRIAIQHLILGLSVGLVLLLVYRFSLFGVIGVPVVTMVCAVLLTTFGSASDILSRLNGPIVLIHDEHASTFEDHSETEGLGALVDLLDRNTESLVIQADAVGYLEKAARSEWSKISGVIMIGPRASFTSRQKSTLVEYVAAGGRLLYSSGFLESRAQGRWLEAFDAEITPVTLGAGQDVKLKAKEYGAAPKLSESWKLNLDENWSTILECFESPVVAQRNFGSGKVCIVSDSRAMLAEMMQIQPSRAVRPEAFQFYSYLITQLFQSPGISAVERSQ